MVDLTAGQYGITDLWVHDEKDYYKASMLSRFFDHISTEGHFPRPFGVIFAKERPCYEEAVHAQLGYAKEKMGAGDLDALIRGKQTWEVV